MNSYGPDRSTFEDEFRAFDILPLCVRRAICEAALPWGAKAAAEMLIAGEEPETLAAMIRHYDAALLPVECAKAYGPEHPEAGAN